MTRLHIETTTHRPFGRVIDPAEAARAFGDQDFIDALNDNPLPPLAYDRPASAGEAVRLAWGALGAMMWIVILAYLGVL